MGRMTFCMETSLQKASGPGQTRLEVSTSQFVAFKKHILAYALSSPVDSFALQVSSALILRLSFRKARLLGNVSHDV